MANFYNPYMKGPDWGQGINQFASQLMMLKMLREQGAGNEPGNVANITPFENGAIGGVATPDLSGKPMMSIQGRQPSPAPTDGKLDIKGLGGQISQSELNMIMKVLQALQQSKGGLPGMGGV